MATAQKLPTASPKRSSLPSRFGPAATSSPASELELGGGDREEHEERGHRGEDHARVAGPAGHAAEEPDARHRDQQDRGRLDERGEERRVLEGVGRVGTEVAAAVGAELLDRDDRRDGAARDPLDAAFEGLGDRGAFERHRRAADDQEEGDDEREREQHEDDDARDVSVEVTEGEPAVVALAA